MQFLAHGGKVNKVKISGQANLVTTLSRLKVERDIKIDVENHAEESLLRCFAWGPRVILMRPRNLECIDAAGDSPRFPTSEVRIVSFLLIPTPASVPPRILGI
jgi:hypothetical protein